jgi:hypothetical protein
MATIPVPDTAIVFRDGFSSPSPKETGCKVRGSNAPDFFYGRGKMHAMKISRRFLQSSLLAACVALPMAGAATKPETPKPQ